MPKKLFPNREGNSFLSAGLRFSPRSPFLWMTIAHKASIATDRTPAAERARDSG
jgi:hypothetical protein